MKIFTIVLLSLIFQFAFSMTCHAETNDALLEKYYGEYNTADGTGLTFASARLRVEVPLKAQGEFFARLIDRASKNPGDYRVLVAVMDELYGRESSFAWNSHLEKSLLSLATNPSQGVRGMFVKTLAMKDEAKYRKICLSFLDDDSDTVRDSAVTAITGWSDRGEILRDYINKNRTKPDHTKSVASATRYLAVLEHTTNNH